METKQVLSVEQMKHLQELGLDTSDASIYRARVSHGSRIDDKSKGVWFLSLHKEFQTCGFMSYEILPTYTLQDILDKLPESVQVYDLYIFKKVGLWWLKYVDVTNNGTVRLEKMPKLIDAAYYMLCWCIQKGLLKLIRRLKMEEKKIDWEQRRYELAKAAMQALISNSFFMKNLGMYLDEHPDKKMDAIEVVAIESINYTDVLIKKLKGE